MLTRWLRDYHAEPLHPYLRESEFNRIPFRERPRLISETIAVYNDSKVKKRFDCRNVDVQVTGDPFINGS